MILGDIDGVKILIFICHLTRLSDLKPHTSKSILHFAHNKRERVRMPMSKIRNWKCYILIFALETSCDIECCYLLCSNIKECCELNFKIVCSLPNCLFILYGEISYSFKNFCKRSIFPKYLITIVNKISLESDLREMGSYSSTKSIEYSGHRV
jgi:hypothetical protein